MSDEDYGRATPQGGATATPVDDEVLAQELLRIAAKIGIVPDGACIDDVLFCESLQAVELRAVVARDLGRDLPLTALLRGTSARTLLLEATEASDESATEVEHDEEARFEPFPLTPIQGAYLLGRTDAVPLGGRSAHYYVEVEVDDIACEALDAGFRLLLDRHDSLRSVIHPDGTQQVLRDLPAWRLPVQDLSGCTGEEREQLLLRIRDEMADQSFNPAVWPLFDIRMSRLASDRVRVHFSCDLLLLDAQSISILIGEWLTAATLPAALAAPPAITFRDLLLAGRPDPGRQTAHARAAAYWQERLDTLPPAPALPFVGSRLPSAPRFSRRETQIDAKRFAVLRERARSLGVTPTAVLAAIYAETLAGWSAEPAFTLNVTLSERPRELPDAARVLGDFTGSLLVACDDVEGGVDARARALQTRLADGFAHMAFSGVEVQRELAIRHGTERAAMPVVFTSTLGERDPFPASARLLCSRRVRTLADTARGA